MSDCERLDRKVIKTIEPHPNQNYYILSGLPTVAADCRKMILIKIYALMCAGKIYNLYSVCLVISELFVCR